MASMKGCKRAGNNISGKMSPALFKKDQEITGVVITSVAVACFGAGYRKTKDTGYFL